MGERYAWCCPRASKGSWAGLTARLNCQRPISIARQALQHVKGGCTQKRPRGMGMEKDGSRLGEYQSAMARRGNKSMRLVMRRCREKTIKDRCSISISLPKKRERSIDLFVWGSRTAPFRKRCGPGRWEDELPGIHALAPEGQRVALEIERVGCTRDVCKNFFLSQAGEPKGFFSWPICCTGFRSLMERVSSTKKPPPLPGECMVGGGGWENRKLGLDSWSRPKTGGKSAG